MSLHGVYWPGSPKLTTKPNLTGLIGSERDQLCDRASELTDVRQAFVLVVDDHKHQRALFKILANRLGVVMHVVESGEEALAAIEACSFDAVLMDVRMPNMDGWQCTKKIREMEKLTARHIPVIAVTACVMPGDREKCLDAGMDDYLPKPFTLGQLGQKLKEWIKDRAI